MWPTETKLSYSHKVIKIMWYWLSLHSDCRVSWVQNKKIFLRLTICAVMFLFSAFNSINTTDQTQPVSTHIKGKVKSKSNFTFSSLFLLEMRAWALEASPWHPSVSALLNVHVADGSQGLRSETCWLGMLPQAWFKRASSRVPSFAHLMLKHYLCT